MSVRPILTIIFVSLCLLATLLVAARAAEESQCALVWQETDVNGDSRLQAEEAANLAPLGTADDAAALMTRNEFMDACLKGTFDSIFEEQEQE